MIEMNERYEELCKGCERKFHRIDAGGRDKFFCFGLATPEGREVHNIPDYDNLRFCIKHPPLKKLPVKNLFQLNMNETEVRVLIEGLSRLLKT